jgi:hypothetical protein
MQYYIPEDWNPHLYLCEKLQKLQIIYRWNIFLLLAAVPAISRAPGT